VIYLELPDVTSFKEEALHQKLKEIRAVSVWQTIPAQPVAAASLSLVLTASNGRDIIRCVESIGRASAISKEEVEALAKKGNEAMSKLIKDFKPIAIRKGMYKYPSEGSV
jgi:hypothetical protein